MVEEDDFRYAKCSECICDKEMFAYQTLKKNSSDCKSTSICSDQEEFSEIRIDFLRIVEGVLQSASNINEVSFCSSFVNVFES